MNLIEESNKEVDISMPDILYRRCVYCYTAATAILMNNACIEGTGKKWQEEDLNNVEESSVMLYDIFLKAVLLELACLDNKLDMGEVDIIDNICEYADLFDLVDMQTAILHASNGSLQEVVNNALEEEYGKQVVDFFKVILDEDKIYRDVIIDCTISICAFLVSIDGEISPEEDSKVSELVSKYFN